MTLRAQEKDLSLWSGSGAQFGRYDYRHSDHRIDEMLNDEYFGGCATLLKEGDIITIIDCEDVILDVRVDWLDRRTHIVKLSKLERRYAMPVVPVSSDPEDPGLVYRWRAKRGGGHSIMNAKGQVVAVNFAAKDLAEQAIAVMNEKKIYSAPVGHEPTSEYVKNAEVAR